MKDRSETPNLIVILSEELLLNCSLYRAYIYIYIYIYICIYIYIHTHTSKGADRSEKKTRKKE